MISDMRVKRVGLGSIQDLIRISVPGLIPLSRFAVFMEQINEIRIHVGELMNHE